MARHMKYKYNTSIIKKRIEKIKTDHKKLMKTIESRIRQCKKAHKLSMQRIKDKFSPPKAKPSQKPKNAKQSSI
jgi:hypothetical protein